MSYELIHAKNYVKHILVLCIIGESLFLEFPTVTQNFTQEITNIFPVM